MFETRKDVKYSDFEEVRRVIDELTEEVAGKAFEPNIGYFSFIL